MAEREFSLRELEFFPQAGPGFDVRKLKTTLVDVFFTDEFSGYQSKFTRLFGIASDRAASPAQDTISQRPRRPEQVPALILCWTRRRPSDDVKWRNLVLDVRQHVEFSATEFDDTGVEMETLDSGAGKSGGHRQKLTTTCLAAALRYQLAGEDGVWPSYSTVVMDEAFDRADNDFTAMVMNIFKNFGFQVVAATPVTNVMALVEPCK